MTETWDTALSAYHASQLRPDGTMTLEGAVRAWADSSSTLVWATMSASTDPSHEVADPGALATAAAKEVALAARQLAAHHDDTLLYQLGYSPGNIQQIRDWARGTPAQLAAALAAAQAAGRPLQRSDLAGLTPAPVTNPPLLAPGVTGPGQPS